MIPYKDLKVGMEVEALSPRRTGKRWLPARVLAPCKFGDCKVRVRIPDGTHRTIWRELRQLRLKPEGGAG